MLKVYVFDPTASDSQNKVRGVGRYLQILRESFPQWNFVDHIGRWKSEMENSVFINPFFNFLKSPLTLKRIAKKQIAVIHDLIPLKYPDKFPAGARGKLNIFLNKIALKNYDMVVVDSYAVKKDVVKILKINEKKIKVIYPSLPKIFFKDFNLNKDFKESPSLPRTFCLYVGDATWNKNLVNLAKAIKIINVTCLFVGKVFEDNQLKIKNTSHPWQKELRMFLHEIKDDKRFICLGYLDDYRLIKLYEQGRCNILVSKDEGFGFSYLESAVLKTPSVLSNIAVFKEIAKNYALFANPNNPNDIADKIGELYFNDDVRKKIGFEAQKRAISFNEESFKKSYNQLIYE